MNIDIAKLTNEELNLLFASIDEDASTAWRANDRILWTGLNDLKNELNKEIRVRSTDVLNSYLASKLSK